MQPVGVRVVTRRTLPAALSSCRANGAAWRARVSMDGATSLCDVPALPPPVAARRMAALSRRSHSVGAAERGWPSRSLQRCCRGHTMRTEKGEAATVGHLAPGRRPPSSSNSLRTHPALGFWSDLRGGSSAGSSRDVFATESVESESPDTHGQRWTRDLRTWIHTPG